MTTKELLLKLGITPNLNGFYYIDYCVNIILKNLKDKSLPEHYSTLYRLCAHHYNTMSITIERCIRYARNAAEEKSTDTFNAIFDDVKNSLSNSVFIAMIAEYIFNGEANDT